MPRYIDAYAIGVRTPEDRVRILWEVDGVSGSTSCAAWQAQHAIELLEAAGYTINSIERED